MSYRSFNQIAPTTWFPNRGFRLLLQLSTLNYSTRYVKHVKTFWADAVPT